MSELHLGPPPSRNALPAVIAAAVVLALIAAAVFYFNPHKTADIRIAHTALYAAHTTFKAIPGSVHIVGEAGSAQDDLYVAVTVSITDKLRLPLFIKDETAVLINADDTTLNAGALTPATRANVVLSFPDVAPLAANPLDRNTQIAPGQTTTGTLLLHFPHTTEAAWRARKSATITLEFFHQNPATLTIP